MHAGSREVETASAEYEHVVPWNVMNAHFPVSRSMDLQVGDVRLASPQAAVMAVAHSDLERPLVCQVWVGSCCRDGTMRSRQLPTHIPRLCLLGSPAAVFSTQLFEPLFRVSPQNSHAKGPK